MTRKQKRLTVIACGLGALGVAAGLILFALRQEIVFFRTPSDLETKPAQVGVRFRLGGLVEKGSIRSQKGAKTLFIITDKIAQTEVSYTGILPDLFSEETGVVAEGAFNAQNIFIADTVLAKHDETYVPKEVMDSMKEKGVWRDLKGNQ
jgi:cytochrome c-type biogenesis protein CcmE